MAQTQLEILKRLVTSFQAQNSDVSTVEGTFTTDTLSANSVEFEKAYAEIDLVHEAAFVQTSWGDELTKKCAEHGVLRRDATKSQVTLTITGTAGATVPKGSLFATASNMGFLTAAAAVIGADGTVDVKAEAQTAGAAYNVTANTIVKIPVSIYGVNAVNNSESAVDGYDIESDDDLRTRTLFKVQNQATSGNVNHYILWATSVGGVGKVKVLPLWNGNGTVKVVIGDTNNDFASTELVERVAAHIESVRPIGPTVTVAAPDQLDVTIAFAQTDGTATADEVTTAVNEYFRNNLFAMKYISIAQIGRVLLENTNVKDYVNLTINGTTSNITLTDTQLPLVKAVNIT